MSNKVTSKNVIKHISMHIFIKEFLCESGGGHGAGRGAAGPRAALNYSYYFIIPPVTFWILIAFQSFSPAIHSVENFRYCHMLSCNYERLECSWIEGPWLQFMFIVDSLTNLTSIVFRPSPTIHVRTVTLFIM